jgi:hypothetical protein
MEGSVPIAAVVVEAVAPLTPGQRVSVCRLKDEYSDPVDGLSAAEVEGESILNERNFLAISVLCLMAFFLIPCMRAVKVACGCSREGSKYDPDINIKPPSPTSGPLRAAGKDFEDWPVLPPQSPVGGSGAVVSGYPVHHPHEVEDVHPFLDPNSPDEEPISPTLEPPETEPPRMEVPESSTRVSGWTRKSNAKATDIEGMQTVKPSEGEEAHRRSIDNGNSVAPSQGADLMMLAARGSAM